MKKNAPMNSNQIHHPETKSQHFVPRVYLRRFATDGKRLWVFDKTTGKSYPTTVDKAGQRNRFYDVPVGGVGVPSEWEKQHIEKWLGHGEAQYGTDLDAVVAAAESGQVISTDLKQRLSLPIVTQWVRTPQFRDHLVARYELLRSQARDEADERGLSEDETERLCIERGVGLAVGEQEAAVRHAHLMLEPFAMKFTREHITDCAWVIGRNTTQSPFYTSDDPLVDCLRGFYTMFLPISSNHILLMYLPHSYPPYMAPFSLMDGSCVDLDDGQVRHFNRMQVSQCQRHVFCSANDFDLASKVADGTVPSWTAAEEHLDIPFMEINPEYVELGRGLKEGAREVQVKYAEGLERAEGKKVGHQSKT